MSAGLGGEVPGGATLVDGAREAVRLHVPDEPLGRRGAWYEAVLDGEDLAAIVAGEGGVAEWLWERWRVLEAEGISAGDFYDLVVAYRREVWLWLAGERTWAQCCAGLLGRIGRRAGARSGSP
ncbi:MAG TPA: hypothetical protein VKV36_02140 [Acidimicrobiales bacterium]|nr:hypothetical protein [Acidimicrobiales bacterium]